MKTFKEYSQEVDEPVVFDENFMGYGSDAGGNMISRHTKRVRDSDRLHRNYLVGKDEYPDRKPRQHHDTYNAQWEKHKEGLQAKKDADKGTVGKVISKAKVALHKKVYGIHPTVKEEAEIDEASVVSYPILNSVTGKALAAKERAEFKRGVSRLVSKAKYNAKKKAAKTVEEESELTEDDVLGLRGLWGRSEDHRSGIKRKQKTLDARRAELKDRIKNQLGKHTKPNLPEETELDEGMFGTPKDKVMKKLEAAHKYHKKYFPSLAKDFGEAIKAHRAGKLEQHLASADTTAAEQIRDAINEETSLDEGMYLVGTYSNPKKEHIRVWQHSPAGYHYSIENTKNKKILTHHGSLDAAVKKHSLVLNKEEYEPAPNVPRHIRAHANRSGGTHYNILGKLQKKQFTKDKQDHDDEGAIERAAARRKGW